MSNWQLTLVALTAWAAIAAIVVAALAMGVAAITDAIGMRREKGFAQGRDFQRNLLASDAWWFPEPEASLIRDLAHGVETGEARARWKKAKAASGSARGASDGAEARQ